MAVSKKVRGEVTEEDILDKRYPPVPPTTTQTTTTTTQPAPTPTLPDVTPIPVVGDDPEADIFTPSEGWEYPKPYDPTRSSDDRRSSPIATQYQQLARDEFDDFLAGEGDYAQSQWHESRNRLINTPGMIENVEKAIKALFPTTVTKLKTVGDMKASMGDLGFRLDTEGKFQMTDGHTKFGLWVQVEEPPLSPQDRALISFKAYWDGLDIQGARAHPHYSTHLNAIRGDIRANDYTSSAQAEADKWERSIGERVDYWFENDPVNGYKARFEAAWKAELEGMKLVLDTDHVKNSYSWHQANTEYQWFLADNDDGVPRMEEKWRELKRELLTGDLVGVPPYELGSTLAGIPTLISPQTAIPITAWIDKNMANWQATASPARSNSDRQDSANAGSQNSKAKDAATQQSLEDKNWLFEEWKKKKLALQNLIDDDENPLNDLNFENFYQAILDDMSEDALLDMAASYTGLDSNNEPIGKAEYMRQQMLGLYTAAMEGSGSFFTEEERARIAAARATGDPGQVLEAVQGAHTVRQKARGNTTTQLVTAAEIRKAVEANPGAYLEGVSLAKMLAWLKLNPSATSGDILEKERDRVEWRRSHQQDGTGGYVPPEILNDAEALADREGKTFAEALGLILMDPDNAAKYESKFQNLFNIYGFTDEVRRMVRTYAMLPGKSMAQAASEVDNALRAMAIELAKSGLPPGTFDPMLIMATHDTPNAAQISLTQSIQGIKAGQTAQTAAAKAEAARAAAVAAGEPVPIQYTATQAELDLQREQGEAMARTLNFEAKIAQYGSRVDNVAALQTDPALWSPELRTFIESDIGLALPDDLALELVRLSPLFKGGLGQGLKPDTFVTSEMDPDTGRLRQLTEEEIAQKIREQMKPGGDQTTNFVTAALGFIEGAEAQKFSAETQYGGMARQMAALGKAEGVAPIEITPPTDRDPRLPSIPGREDVPTRTASNIDLWRARAADPTRRSVPLSPGQQLHIFDTDEEIQRRTIKRLGGFWEDPAKSWQENLDAYIRANPSNRNAIISSVQQQRDRETAVVHEQGLQELEREKQAAAQTEAPSQSQQRVGRPPLIKGS